MHPLLTTPTAQDSLITSSVYCRLVAYLQQLVDDALHVIANVACALQGAM
jgi:hypothetical protein